MFFKKSLHKIIDYVIFAYSFNPFTTLRKKKSQNFHAILFYLTKKTKWSYELQIPKTHGIDKNDNNNNNNNNYSYYYLITIKLYLTVNISSDDYKF